MSDEVAKLGLTERVLESCRVALEDQNTPSQQNERLLALLEKSLTEDNLLESLAQMLADERDVWHKHLDEETVGRLLRGHIFEALALESLPQEERPYKELERFLLWSLKDPRIWYVDWEQEGLEPLTKAERKQLATYMRVRPDENELHALRNNDAIAIDIKTDPETKRSVAVITGVVEAKNHGLSPAGSDEVQMRTAPDILHDVVMRYKRSFPLLMKGLDIGAGMPDEIDILPPEQLSYTIIQPADLDTEAEHALIPEAFKNCHFEYAPVTRREVVLLAKALEPFVLAGLDAR